MARPFSSVDTVCINKANIPERMQQVSHINSEAERTLLYLGGLDCESEKGLAALTMFSKTDISDLPIWKDETRQLFDFSFLEPLNRLLRYHGGKGHGYFKR